MIAPDVNADVRARFEASYLRLRGIKEPSDRMCHWLFRRSGDGYVSAPVSAEWTGYSAAHADLAGDVRELVEADRRYDAAMRSEADTCGMLRREYASERRAAALAKFPTHKEKP